MDDTTFEVTYEFTGRSPTVAVDEARDRLGRALVAVADYVVRGERRTTTDDGCSVTLLVELTRVEPHVRTNLAFHAFFRASTVEAV